MKPDLAPVLKELGLGGVSLETLASMPQGTIYSLTVPGSKALEVWLRLRDLVPTSGCWPVILPLEFDTWEGSPGWTPAESILGDLLGVADEWLEAQRLEEAPYQEEHPPACPWPARGRPMKLQTLDRSVLQRWWHTNWNVRMALVPTVLCWEVPAWLAYGDWEANPPPHVHVALLHRWHEAFGAEIVSAGSRIGCRIQRPPADRDSALALAEEMFLYCGDLTQEGYESEPELAASLLVSPYWSFWWD